MELFILVFWIVPVVLGGIIWSNKGGSGVAGAMLGLFLGWLGVLLAAVATPSKVHKAAKDKIRNSRECPHCREAMHREATVCPHCQRDVEPEPLPQIHVDSVQCPTCLQMTQPGARWCRNCRKLIRVAS